MPPRTTEESYRPRVSDRTMVGNSAIVMLVSFKKRMGAVTTGEMELQGGRGISPFRVTKRSTKLRRLSKTTRRSRVHVQTVGLNAETKKVSAPSPWENISLDIPFYRTFWRGTGQFSTRDIQLLPRTRDASKFVLNNNKLSETIVPLLRWILSFEDFSLQFLVFLHLVLGLRSVARFAI